MPGERPVLVQIRNNGHAGNGNSGHTR
jgi:hypothetical protein